MFNVLPAKFGVPVADGVGVDAARGALQAVATSSAATSGARKRIAFGTLHLPSGKAGV
jgi:hypothetical protein